MTDFELDVLQTMQCSIEANGLESSMQVRFLEWGDASTYLTDEPFDLIVGAEVLYETGGDEGSAPLLAHALQAHIPEGSQTTAIISYRQRKSRAPLKFFKEIIKAGFSVERLQGEDGQAVCSAAGDPASIYEGCRFVSLGSDAQACTEQLTAPAKNGHILQLRRS